MPSFPATTGSPTSPGGRPSSTTSRRRACSRRAPCALPITMPRSGTWTPAGRRSSRASGRSSPTGRAAQRLRTSRGPRGAGRRAPAGRGCRPVARSARGGRGRRGRRHRHGGVGAHRRRVRGAPGAVRHPARPGAGRAWIHPWGPVFPHFGPHNHRRVRKGDIEWAMDAADTIVSGSFGRRPSSTSPGDAGRARHPRARRPADHLLLHPGDVLLARRGGGPPQAAAQPDQVHRRHGRGRLRREGRHRLGDDRRRARPQGATAGEMAMDARGGVPGLLHPGARGTSRSRTR